MKKLLALAGTLLLVIFNIVQTKSIMAQSNSVGTDQLGQASSNSLENCGTVGL